MLIQIILLAGAIVLLALFVRQWDRVRTRAWKRLAFLAFVGTNIYAIVRPEDTTWVAKHMGVGRGTDLILYLLVIGVAFMTLNTYMRFRSLEKKITDLARTIAIRDAQLLNQDRISLLNSTMRNPSNSSKASAPAPEVEHAHSPGS
jgi:small membrane protein